MAKDTVTSRPRCLLFSYVPKWERIGETHLSYYDSAYNRVETNQPPQDLFISSVYHLVSCCSSVPVTYEYLTICCIISFQC